MKHPLLILLALLGLATGVRGQDCDLTIHLSTGETVTIPHAEIRRMVFVLGPSSLTDDGDQGGVPGSFRLLPNYPNPFNPSTTIRYELPGATTVRVRVYDLHGALVRDLFDGKQEAGLQRVVWDGLDEQGVAVASGVYLCAVRGAETTLSRQLVLIK